MNLKTLRKILAVLQAVGAVMEIAALVKKYREERED